ncbi:hypothetical protein [Spirosoma luteum]|uniref:hypothetical protein n=1 Tax=Spirosoma luteum TaxID=431553 RepID=UPI000363DC01|nr:hypothetical protein [Spirosoma luteum]
MENTNQQSPDQGSGTSTKGLSPQHNDMPANEGDDAVVYAGLGVNNEPDIRNQGDEEGTDTLLFTDTATARHATDGVSNDAEPDEFPVGVLDGTMSDDEIDEQITELAEEEEEGNEPY